MFAEIIHILPISEFKELGVVFCINYGGVVLEIVEYLIGGIG